MLIADLFGLEELFLLEPSYERLVDPIYTDQFIALEAKEGRVLVDKEERPLAIAAMTDRWYATSLLHREPTDALIELVGEMELEVYQTDRADFAAAAREYYSLLISETVEPAMEDDAPERYDMVMSLLKESFGRTKLKGKTCLDVGCGTGRGSGVLHGLGMKALAYDMDAGLLARGLKAGRLYHHETMMIDATHASAYIDPVEFGMILMAGKITDFNSFLWRQIVQQTNDLTDVMIVTLETEKEARMIVPWCKDRKVDVFENDRDPFYDRWVVLAK